MKTANKEFEVGFSRYTPRAATVNGVAGRIWVKRQHIDGAWVHQGSTFARKAAPEIEVEASFLAAA